MVLIVLNKVESYILDNNMLSLGDRIVIGLSGGADSVCLFDVLIKLSKKYELTLFVVHVNHGIRGKEAHKDQVFVEKLCKSHNISYSSVLKDVPSIAKDEGISEEEAGRKIRYQAFNDWSVKNKCNKIAVAHNKNDNAETILFNLFRGSGIRGLTGIPATRASIIRPLLCVEREEIEAYLDKNQIPYIIDSTNLSEDYSRNKIRNRILAYAKAELNSGVIGHITNSADMLFEIDTFIKRNVDQAFNKYVYKKADNKEVKEYCIKSTDFNKLDIVIQKELIRKIIKDLSRKLKDISSSHIDLVINLANKQVGKEISLPYRIFVSKGYDHISFRKKDKTKEYNIEKTNKFKAVEMTIPGSVPIPYMEASINTNLRKYEKAMEIPKEVYTKWIDYDKIDNILSIRTRQKGDFIQVDSKGSRKKLKSLFIDEKIPREERDDVLLIADGSHIVWVIGGRISEAYKVDENSKTILEISLYGGNRNGRQN